MRVHVDHDRCFGFGRCVDIAPNTFRLNEGGQSITGEPRDDEDAIQQAAWACPTQAIEIITKSAPGPSS
ncbi:MAG: ferredoxin [Pseudonocardiaceae bacterium]|nr:ferredoxin [Pseudonocardiaceae bacterium]